MWSGGCQAPELRAGDHQQRPEATARAVCWPMAMLGMEIPRDPNPGACSELAGKKGQVFYLKNVPDVRGSALCCASHRPPKHGECTERRNASEISSLCFATPVSEQGKQQIRGVLSSLPREILCIIGGSENSQPSAAGVAATGCTQRASLSFPIPPRQHPHLPSQRQGRLSIAHPPSHAICW